MVFLGAIAAYSVYLNSARTAIRELSVVTASSSGSSRSNSDQVAADRMASLEKMIFKDPQNAAIRAQLGNLYYDLGQYEKAITAYRESLKLQPNDAGIETDLATCFHYLGQHAKALEILDKVLGYSPNFPQALFNKGVVLIDGDNNIRDGIAVWENLLRTDPEFAKKADLQNKISKLRRSVN